MLQPERPPTATPPTTFPQVRNRRPGASEGGVVEIAEESQNPYPTFDEGQMPLPSQYVSHFPSPPTTASQQYEKDEKKPRSGASKRSILAIFVVVSLVIAFLFLAFVASEVYHKYVEINDIHHKNSLTTYTTFTQGEQKLDSLLQSILQLSSKFDDLSAKMSQVQKTQDTQKEILMITQNMQEMILEKLERERKEAKSRSSTSLSNEEKILKTLMGLSSSGRDRGGSVLDDLSLYNSKPKRRDNSIDDARRMMESLRRNTPEEMRPTKRSNKNDSVNELLNSIGKKGKLASVQKEIGKLLSKKKKAPEPERAVPDVPEEEEFQQPQENVQAVDTSAPVIDAEDQEPGKAPRGEAEIKQQQEEERKYEEEAAEKKKLEEEQKKHEEEERRAREEQEKASQEQEQAMKETEKAIQMEKQPEEIHEELKEQNDQATEVKAEQPVEQAKPAEPTAPQVQFENKEPVVDVEEGKKPAKNQKEEYKRNAQDLEEMLASILGKKGKKGKQQPQDVGTSTDGQNPTEINAEEVKKPETKGKKKPTNEDEDIMQMLQSMMQSKGKNANKKKIPVNIKDAPAKRNPKANKADDMDFEVVG